MKKNGAQHNEQNRSLTDDPVLFQNSATNGKETASRDPEILKIAFTISAQGDQSKKG